ncbi:hypothetical protein FOQG_14850 [Fusarium oxysporum f. sp. raphani 54005]|uniref:Isopenicillin N synthase-like Fe(2+) 2OG dioxygenase domain-containing protein n=1 Tax=Fusarium oxysporum f. sp. raphani 54005 TaxID=1089458 RepID=X0BQ93_FUSOX|nr:hypothetical protein FOQG_14850 [Fusarium oxysporum f. sp. raphani 54005]
MNCYARSEEESKKLGGTLFNFSQVSNTLTFEQFQSNGGDGFLKSSIHRVVASPKDKAYINRLGALYIVREEDDTDLVPIQISLVLCEHGLLDYNVLTADGKPLKAGEWVKQRVIKSLGSLSTAKDDNEEHDVEILEGGVKVKYYD